MSQIEEEPPQSQPVEEGIIIGADTISLPGQKYPTPSPGSGDRVFYETLLEQKPASHIAQEWCVYYGVLDTERATTLYAIILKRKGTTTASSGSSSAVKASASPAKAKAAPAAKKTDTSHGKATKAVKAAPAAKKTTAAKPAATKKETDAKAVKAAKAKAAKQMDKKAAAKKEKK